MFIQVRLLNGFAKPLWYKMPREWGFVDLRHKIVQVPLRNRIVPAIVLHQFDQKPKTNFDLKDAHAIEAFPNDTFYKPFIEQLSAYYQVEPLYFFKRIRSFITQTIKKPIELPQLKNEDIKKEVKLTNEQQKVTEFLKPAIINKKYTPTVIHGVTGSGKTEIYKEALLHAYKQNKSTILLLPEVTLAVEFEHRLKRELPNHIQLCSFHSSVGAKEKRLLWQLILQEKPVIIIGVHLPILLPIANLGLIIIDEEHETGYQEKKHPKINSKDVALLRAQKYNVPIILGSATPSLQTLYNVKKRNWHLFQLKNRFAGAFPKIKTVQLTDGKQRKNFWISKQLYFAIKDRLEKKEQILIFLNRRGFSFFVQCKPCGFIFACASCSVSLTLHKNNMLTCHYCGTNQTQPANCPSCKADEKDFLKKGIGTQQVVSILQKLYPTARVARADMDSTIKKKKWQETMQSFVAGNLDILVGTQTITKGYDFANVTLVGILWADLNLHFPIYNAAENTLQQLIQVAGRAGRQKKESLVIVQTMADHPIFSFINEVDYLQFYEHELEKRNEMGYPPCKRLVEIELKHADDTILEREAHDITVGLFSENMKNNYDATILGPAKPPVYKIKNTYMRKIYIKSPSMKTIIDLYRTIETKKYSTKIFFTPNPQA